MIQLNLHKTVNSKKIDKFQKQSRIFLKIFFFIFKLQGSIMVASLGQILIGLTGLPGILMRFIGPITIAPTVTMVGMGLWKDVADKASTNWLITFV